MLTPALRRGMLAVATLTLLLATSASAHIERASYWPDPKPDMASGVSTGGKVPQAKTLASAVAKGQKGTTRVVCQSNSLTLLKADIANARKNGYDVRPTEHHKFSKKQFAKLLYYKKNVLDK